MDVRWILHLTDVGAVVGKLDLSNYDGGITARNIPIPKNALPEDALWRRIWSLLVVEHLQVEFDGYIWLKQQWQ